MASGGIEVFNRAGVRVFTTSDRITRIIGSFDVSANGSFSVLNESGGELWSSFSPYFVEDFNVARLPVPVITISGNTISWSYPGGASGRMVRLTYGVY